LDRIVGRATRAIEGQPWGFFESTVIGHGTWMREHLVLFPPDAGRSARRAYGVYRCWPVVGACLAVVFMIVIGAVLPPALAFVASFSLYFVVTWLTSRVTRELRRQSIHLMTLTVAIGGSVRCYGNVDVMRAARASLAALDARVNRGTLLAHEYDLECASVFWSLDAVRADLEDELQEGIQLSQGMSTNN
jgi:hypothetical protein